MKPFASKHHGSDAITKAYRRTQAQSIIIQRGDLESLNIESFCRSWGLREDEARCMIGEERRRRAARG